MRRARQQEGDFDFVLTRGRVVTESQVDVLDIGVVGERIAALGPSGALAERAAHVIDASGSLVLPGGVDPHCHYNLGHNHSGEIRNESQDFSAAAAHGGTTTIIDFAVQDQPMTLHEAIKSKRAEADGRMAVDYGLHAIVTGPVSFETLEEIPSIVAAGVPTIKTFMTYDWMVDDGDRFGVMEQVAGAGGMSLVHAEDDALARWFRRKFIHEGKTAGRYISQARGPLVEEAAIRRALLLAERSGCPLYVLHIAAGAAVAALREARQRRAQAFGETLAGYLSFTSEELWDERPIHADGKRYPNRGLMWSSFPPLKSAEDQLELWRGLQDGSLQVVSSDHSAFSVADRYEHMGCTLEDGLMQGGNAAVELRVPVLFHLGVMHGQLSLNRFVDLIATQPARLMGLYPRKGVIAVGSDADLVVIDPRRSWEVSWPQLHMSPQFSCWEGWRLDGQITTVMLRGCVLVSDGNFVGPRSTGKYLERTLDPSLMAVTS